MSEAAANYEKQKLAQETLQEREKKEALAEKNREKRELTRMRRAECCSVAAWKHAGEGCQKKNGRKLGGF